MKKIIKPNADEYPAFYGTYVRVSPEEGDILRDLNYSFEALRTFIESLPAEKLTYCYAEGKWTIKELLIHLIDSERIFAYRALRIARADQTPLAGFDENEYVPNSGANERSLVSILREYTAVRFATIELFANMTAEMLARIGHVNGGNMSARALPYIIAGHEAHHLRIIRERYL
jgi:transposase